ncbi:uncharacterized protein [Anolis sagrei]|uniref:uncharacterized protein n=1 Tax=Anolis sagrei TaxID=38937 RepID=UPI00351FAA13
MTSPSCATRNIETTKLAESDHDDDDKIPISELLPGPSTSQDHLTVTTATPLAPSIIGCDRTGNDTEDVDDDLLAAVLPSRSQQTIETELSRNPLSLISKDYGERPPKIHDEVRKILVERGPPQVTDKDFPQDAKVLELQLGRETDEREASTPKMTEGPEKRKEIPPFAQGNTTGVVLFTKGPVQYKEEPEEGSQKSWESHWQEFLNTVESRCHQTDQSGPPHPWPEEDTKTLQTSLRRAADGIPQSGGEDGVQTHCDDGLVVDEDHVFCLKVEEEKEEDEEEAAEQKQKQFNLLGFQGANGHQEEDTAEPVAIEDLLPARRPAKLPRRIAYWSAHEINALLDYVLQCQRLYIQRVMASTNLRTRNVWIGASRAMALRGLNRTPDQCHTKFKALKGAFYRAMERHGGVVPRKMQPPFFAKLHQLWEIGGRADWRDRRPVADAYHRKGGEGGDSSLSGEESGEEERIPIAPVPGQAPHAAEHRTVQEAVSLRQLQQQQRALEQRVSAIENTFARLQANIQELLARLPAPPPPPLQN